MQVPTTKRHILFREREWCGWHGRFVPWRKGGGSVTERIEKTRQSCRCCSNKSCGVADITSTVNEGEK